jgi:hypothetical protein
MRCLTAFFGLVDEPNSKDELSDFIHFNSTQDVPPGDGMDVPIKIVNGMV